MKECFTTLLVNLEEMGQHRTAVLAAADFDADYRQGMYYQLVGNVQPLGASLLCALVPDISFDIFEFSQVEKDYAMADLRSTLQEVIREVFLGLNPGGEHFPRIIASAYFKALCDVLIQHGIYDLFVKLGSFMPSEYHSLQQLFDAEQHYVLAPLAVAATMYAAEHNLPQPDYPTTAQAFRILMWARDAALQTPYLNALSRVWYAADEARLEQSRSAMVEATCQLHAATDGTAAARLLRMHEAYVELRAELHGVSRRFDAQLHELTRLAAQLNQRMPEQNSSALQPADAGRPSTSFGNNEQRVRQLTEQLQIALEQIDGLQQQVGMNPA